MAPPRKKDKKVDEVEPGTVDELTRVTALALRYQGIPMGVLVHDLSDAGLPPGRIATLSQHDEWQRQPAEVCKAPRMAA